VTRKSAYTRVRAVLFGKVHPTRFSGLSYQQQGAGNWRFLDNSTGHPIGASYSTKMELLEDIERYGEVSGFAN
jgi:hypothetical protein